MLVIGKNNSVAPYDGDEDASGLMAESSIVVPEEENGIVFADDESVGANDDEIIRLLTILEEAGEGALTDEEYGLLQQYLRSGQASGEIGHNSNLAEHIEESELNKIAQDVEKWVKWDEESRSEWYEKEKKGVRALGVSPNVDGGANFAGASKVVHPLIAEAIAQFSARAMDSLWPAGGPVKTIVLGKRDEERSAQAKRVEQFMNYQYTQLMPGVYEQFDKMLVRLPVSGSCFTKAYYDPLNGVSRTLVEPADFIVPYRADDLATAPRYTERLLMQPNELRKRQVAGYYRDIKLQEPNQNTTDSQSEEVKDEVKETEGRSPNSTIADDQNHTLYECVCSYDLPGFEDKDETGSDTGIQLEYIITIDKDSREVLSIYRNWRPNDPLKKRIIYHTHYRFMPGLGFYGYGFFHWIGGLATAATGALRALLDAAQFSNMQGGYRSKDAKLKNGDVPLAPGEWREADSDSEELRKAFFNIPYKEPSSTLFSLLGHLEQLGQRFASTTEALVGDGGQNTPVGTILARIEQGTKIHTAIQKRLHRAFAEEFRLIAWLNSVYMDDKYPYLVEDDEQVVLKQDFDDRVDVIPVSDPNFVSNTQRYFMAQAALELADKAPDLYDRREIHKRVLESLKMDGINQLMPDKTEMVARLGPVEEGAAVMVGKPIKAFPEQAHEAHIAVHQQLLQTLPQGHPLGSVINAHIQEHMALAYVQKMQQATGVMFDRIPKDEEGNQVELPPEVENQIAMLAAKAVQEMQPQQQGPTPEEAEQARKDAIVQADIARKDSAAQADQARKDYVAKVQLQSSHEKSAFEQKLKHAETLSELRRENAKAEADLLRRHGLSG